MTAVPGAPDLRVVPIEQIRQHEKIDPLRVERLRRRIEIDRVQLNPMVCAEASSGELVLLDGATRTSALREMGLRHAVVQIVQPNQIELETWHHVVRDCPPEETLSRIANCSGISVVENTGPPLIHLNDERRFSVVPMDTSPNEALNALVDTYIGKWNVSRVADPGADSVAWRFPDWSMIVKFPVLSTEDVVHAAVENDYLPAGITRFVIEGRALRLNVQLALLETSLTQAEKQEQLDVLLEERAHAGRIRRYEETVYVLDD